jgi:hypothetical protein
MAEEQWCKTRIVAIAKPQVLRKHDEQWSALMKVLDGLVAAIAIGRCEKLEDVHTAGVAGVPNRVTNSWPLI